MPIAPAKFDESKLPPGGGGVELIGKGTIKKDDTKSEESHSTSEEQSNNREGKATPGVVRLPVHKVKGLGHGPVVFDFEKDPETGDFHKVPREHHSQDKPKE